jgi:4-diphosphocytidyl-2-C-methyl-D-erythritol kinase
MLAFPNAKINLGLNVIKRREDGYHELETCFYPVPWQEALEILEAEKTSVAVTGIDIPDDDDNIVLKAYQLLQADYNIPSVQLHLHKAIPIGAGLGGGSADAAFTLILLNNLFKLELRDDQLMKYAATLGADCAFFVKNKPMLAKGIGEQLENIGLSLKGKFILMVYPNIHISTSEAYSKISPQKSEMSIKQILVEYNISDWKHFLKNDFEPPLFETYPILKEIKQQLYESGALYASMSGSGSCMYGIFDDNPQIVFPEHYKICSNRLWDF